MSEKTMSCVDCAVRNCEFLDRMYPDFCLTEKLTEEQVEEVLACYGQEDNKKAMIAAAEVESEGYCKDCRVEEVIKFAKKIGAKKLGIATCVGLLRESRTLTKILRSHGFEVYGVACKVGAIPKTAVGIDKKCEELGVSMCNPIMQAKLLNEAETDLNLVMGLCVGHDSLFYKYSQALATTVVTKDRVLGHNPAAALYTAESYYKKLMEE
ncbi:DUF1847 domain-containing protein [Anaerovorax odorimutans]|uniref:DUF1847 domain-containing protein n=1 Tax=Anaerovorax odorimutans TaxID=109327 RepID=A0ABT1RT94_9FIRM|nr:DUF1847 domain-containing protein [Anaerovorax odorimutans]MCQ4638428.1 DUF1847 domain-containing protein [Anaerovorax odorimutans]